MGGNSYGWCWRSTFRDDITMSSNIPPTDRPDADAGRNRRLPAERHPRPSRPYTAHPTSRGESRIFKRLPGRTAGIGAMTRFRGNCRTVPGKVK